MEEIWKRHPKMSMYEFSNSGRFRNVHSEMYIQELYEKIQYTRDTL